MPTCDVCQREFPDKRLLGYHNRHHHAPFQIKINGSTVDSRRGADNKLICPHEGCSHTVDTKKAHLEHLEKVHQEKQAGGDSESSQGSGSGLDDEVGVGVADPMYQRVPTLLQDYGYGLVINTVYRFFACRRHGYAPPQNTEGILRHLRNCLGGAVPPEAREAIDMRVTELAFTEPIELTQDQGVREPMPAVEGLRVYHGLYCGLCGYCCLTDEGMRKHNSAVHGGSQPKVGRVLVQKLFGEPRKLVYFAVVVEDVATEPGRGADPDPGVGDVMARLRDGARCGTTTRSGTAFSREVGWEGDITREGANAMLVPMIGVMDLIKMDVMG
jgi:hypothetical protein